MFAIEQSNFLHALGYAIGHSLWQMSLLWLVYFGLIHVGRWSSSRRYGLAVSASIAGFCWFIFTLIYYSTQLQMQDANAATTLWQEVPVAVTGSKGFLFIYHSVLATLRSLAPYLSCAYLVVMMVLSIRLTNGFRQVKQLRTKGLSKPAIDWRLFVKNHAAVLGITRPVQLFVSNIVTSPLTIGFWKPLILIPLASLNHLSTQQMEAVLLHELAHIRRHDYLLNIILQLAEIMLFFNPFMRVLLKQARQERENSCDDWVLQFRYNAADYARALLAIEEHSMQSLLALGSNNNNEFQLLNRVKRMVAPERRSFNYRQQLGLLFLITLLGLGFTVIKPRTKTEAPAVEVNVVKDQTALTTIQKNFPYAVDLIKNLENIEQITKTVSSEEFREKTEKLQVEAAKLGERVRAQLEPHLKEIEQSAMYAVETSAPYAKDMALLQADAEDMAKMKLFESLANGDWNKIIAPALEESKKTIIRILSPAPPENGNWPVIVAPHVIPAEVPVSRIKEIEIERRNNREEMRRMNIKIQEEQRNVINLNNVHRILNDSIRIIIKKAGAELEKAKVAISKANKASVEAKKQNKCYAIAGNNFDYAFNYNPDNVKMQWKIDNDEVAKTDNSDENEALAEEEEISPDAIQTRPLKFFKKAFDEKVFSEKFKQEWAETQEQIQQAWSEDIQRQVQEQMQQLEQMKNVKARISTHETPNGKVIVIQVER